MENVHEVGQKCPCPHHKMLPLMGILIGLDFFLGALGVLPSNFVGLSWPILLMAGAGSKLGMCKCCAA